MLRLLVVGVVLMATVALAWMAFLPLFFAVEVKARTGFDVRVATLSCNAFTGKLAVRGLVLANPPSFPVGDFMELREFVAEGDLMSLWSGRVELDAFTLDVRRLTLVRRPDGRSNAEVFQQKLLGIQPGDTGAESRSMSATPPAPTPRKFLLRRLVLRFDQLAVIDHSGVTPVTQEYALGLDQRYENVTDTKQLLVPEVLRRLAAANLDPTVGRLVPGDLGQALGNAARGAAARGEELLKDAGQRANDTFRGLREKLEETRKP